MKKKPSSSTVKNDDGETVTDSEEIDKLLEAQKTSYTMDNSWAAKGGKAVQPVFEPLGFDWRINVAVLSSLAARETFVATLGQIAAAEAQSDRGPVDLDTSREEEAPAAAEDTGEVDSSPVPEPEPQPRRRKKRARVVAGAGAPGAVQVQHVETETTTPETAATDPGPSSSSPADEPQD